MGSTSELSRAVTASVFVTSCGLLFCDGKYKGKLCRQAQMQLHEIKSGCRLAGYCAVGVVPRNV
jgi:hypothetical protein